MTASALRNWWESCHLKKSDTSDFNTKEDEKLKEMKLCKLL